MDLLGRFRKLDSSLQRGLDNGLARVFGGAVVPAEIEELLKQEAETALLEDEHHAMIAPDHFVVLLSKKDLASLTENSPQLADQLAGRLNRFLRNEGWQTRERAQVLLRSDEGLHTGQLRCHTSFGVPASAADQSDSGIYSPSEYEAAPSQDASVGYSNADGHSAPAVEYSGSGSASSSTSGSATEAAEGAQYTEYQYPAPQPQHSAGGYAQPNAYQGQEQSQTHTQEQGQGQEQGQKQGQGQGQAQGQQPSAYQAQGDATASSQDSGFDGGHVPTVDPTPSTPTVSAPHVPSFASTNTPSRNSVGNSGADAADDANSAYSDPDTDQPWAQQRQTSAHTSGYDYADGTSYDSAPATRPSVSLLLQDGSSRVHHVSDGETVIGRSGQADFRLPDTGVSRQHAKIVWDGDDVVLVDLDSTNGTFVNDVEIKDWLLDDGDIINLGHSDIEVRIVNQGDIDHRQIDGQ